MEEYQAKAELAVKQSASIPDFCYHGEADLGVTWSFTFSVHRDSNHLEQSNYEVIKADMFKRFPDDCIEDHCNHWAVGWIDHLTVRMLDEQGKVTEAGKAILDWNNALDNYPLADEEDYSRRQYESQLESIQGEGFTEEQAQKIWSYLWENDQQALEDDTDRGYVDTDSIQAAALQLGIKFEEDDCLDALEAYCDIRTTATGEQLIEAVTDFIKENKFTDLEELDDPDCDFGPLVELLRHHGNVWKGDQFYHHYTPEQGEQLRLLQIN